MSEHTFAVAVCAGAALDAPILERCLAALRVAGVQDPIVTTAPPGHGLAVARNAALEQADADVLALIDGDVVVGQDWLSALRAAWSGQDDLGCIGGSVGLRFLGSEPRWMSTALDGAFGIVDGGPEPRDVVPAQATFPGGNLSFDTAALRGVAGFWPARGSAGLHDWFTDEHHAQHELGRSGWRLRFEPSLAAFRVIDSGRASARQVVRQRFAAGARARHVTGATPEHAARRAASALAGAALAALTRRPAVVAERAARGAQLVGALCSPALPARSLDPVADHTPFRHTVPPPRARAHRRPWPAHTQDSPVVLCYHRVGSPGDDPLGLSVSAANFEQQLGVLRTSRTIVPLSAIADGSAPRDAVAITFDDGYVDNLRTALPLLEAASAPATFFIATGHTESGAAFWWDEIVALLHDPGGGRLDVTCAGQTRAWHPGDAEQRRAVRAHLHAWLQPLPPEEIEQALATIRTWAGRDRSPAPALEGDRPMTRAELLMLAASPSATLGAHSRTHISLRFADDARLADELRGARSDLKAWTGVWPVAMSYPFGVPGVDVDDRVIAATRDAGYAIGVLNHPEGRMADLLRIPRVAVADIDGAALLARIGSSTRWPGALTRRTSTA